MYTCGFATVCVIKKLSAFIIIPLLSFLLAEPVELVYAHVPVRQRLEQKSPVKGEEEEEAISEVNLPADEEQNTSSPVGVEDSVYVLARIWQLEETQCSP